MAVEPQLGTEEVYGNRFAYFEFESPQGAQILRHQFRIKVWELHWNLDTDKVDDCSDGRAASTNIASATPSRSSSMSGSKDAETDRSPANDTGTRTRRDHELDGSESRLRPP